jgi:hypothetical protein
MKVKGKNIYNSEHALEFAKSVRGQYIISQALRIARGVLKGYEIDFELYDIEFDEIPKDDKKDHHVTKWNTLQAKQEPSNRADMDFLLSAFPLYMIHEHSIWESDSLDRREEDENSEE